MSLYALALEATVLLGLWLGLAIFQKDPATPGRRSFVALALASALWGVGELASLRDLLPELAADRIKFLGALALPACWLGLAAQAARLELARRVPWFPLLLLAPSMCLYALLYSTRWGALFHVTIQGGEDLRGPLFGVGLAYGYLLVVAGSATLLATAFRWRQPGEWLRRLAVGLSPFVPLTAHVLYVMGDSGWPYDPTPVLLAATLLALRSSAFSGGLLQALPVSQHELLQHLPLGMILTDRRGAVLDLNPAAELSLGVSEREALGRSLDALVDAAPDVLEIQISPVTTQGTEVGQLVLITPPTKRDLPDA